MTTHRVDPANVGVICLGLGRTGTSSLREALEMLNLGPCYHMSVILASRGKDLPAWCKIGDANGEGTAEIFDTLFRDYASVLDYPAAMYPAELYAAYPDAKFLLTTRDPAKWEKSMNATILHASDFLSTKPVKSEFDEAILHWCEKYMQEKYHRGRLRSHTQQEIIDHNERVKNIIPPEKLLVFEVGEGWDRLVNFLGVAKPAELFPHVNDTEAFQENLSFRFNA